MTMPEPTSDEIAGAFRKVGRSRADLFVGNSAARAGSSVYWSEAVVNRNSLAAGIRQECSQEGISSETSAAVLDAILEGYDDRIGEIAAATKQEGGRA
jgi:hypothetical protein